MTLPALKPVQTLFEQIYQAILVTDEQDRIIYANPAALQLLGCTSVEIYKKPYISDYLNVTYDLGTEKKVLIQKPDGEQIEASMLLSNVYYDNKSHNMILLNPIKIGVKSEEEKIRLLLKTIHKDILNRELEIEKLSNEVEARTKVLNAAAIVSETDQFGTITFVNENFCRVAQYTSEELIGKPHNIVRHPDMPKAVFKEMWDTIKAGKIFQGVVKNKAKDGTPYWVIATIAPVLDVDGKPYKYIGVRIDITELVKRGAKIEL
jgi:PAS domain S-box-containing protein